MTTPHAPRNVRSKRSRRRARGTLAGIESLETRLAAGTDGGPVCQCPKGSGGTIVWEWHLTDHLVQSYDAGKPNYVKAQDIVKNPQRVNVNFFPTGTGGDTHIADWAHFNAIAYNAKTDQILVSTREFSEVWMIDHSTTTAQAAGKTGGTSGKGGDLLWALRQSTDLERRRR